MRAPTSITRAEGERRASCEECLVSGADGVILRICASCGHIGCAEGSRGDHAAQHYAETDHPIAVLIGSEGASSWSYPDRRTI